jgi:CDP-4-dehydro-6-deoxyglucose reductase, E3
MSRLTCEGREVPIGDDETVLTALLRAGFKLPSACRAGACQSCLVRATGGEVSSDAQRGLSYQLRTKNYFLACQAKPTRELAVSLEDTAALETRARLAKVHHLGPTVLQVFLEPEGPFPYRGGQYITLLREDGLSRSYSLASSSRDDSGHLELHVRIHPEGAMSSWLQTPEALGAQLRVRGPAGDCFYIEAEPNEELLLIGAGTGLSPLVGILREALRAEHVGKISLFHGATSEAGLYKHDELMRMAETHPNFSYQASVVEGAARPHVAIGKLDEVVLAQIPSFQGRRVYLCGDAPLVARLRRQVFLRGAASSAIHADLFLPSYARV